MVNERYKIAISETLHYLKGITQSDIDKIPNKFMNFLKNNEFPNYKCNFDYTKPLSELELMDETKGLISMICLNYWCDAEEKKNNFLKHLTTNEKQYQEELIERYKPDNIFKDKSKFTQSNTSSETMLIVKYEENFWKKFINKIKSYLKR